MAKVLSFKIEKEARAKLNELRELSGITSDAEAIRKALALYHFCWHRKSEGSPVVMVPDGGLAGSLVEVPLG